MVTRATSLLIIIGHKESLQTDDNWAALIEHCKKNKAEMREGQKLHPRVEAPDCST